MRHAMIANSAVPVAPASEDAAATVSSSAYPSALEGSLLKAVWSSAPTSLWHVLHLFSACRKQNVRNLNRKTIIIIVAANSLKAN